MCSVDVISFYMYYKVFLHTVSQFECRGGASQRPLPWRGPESLPSSRSLCSPPRAERLLGNAGTTDATVTLVTRC